MSKLPEFPALLFGAGVLVGGTLTAAVALAPMFVTQIELEKYAVVTAASAQTVAAPAAASPAAPGTTRLGLGRPALPEEIAAWDVAVLPDGTGLRPGSGSVEDGEEVFIAQCASCHGDFAEGLGQWPVLAGGIGSLTDARPVKTVGSYWPYLSTVWDYVHRSMPFGAAQTVTVDETYAIVAYILYSNGIVDDDFVLTHENFTEITLPNAGGFRPDDRPETEYPLFSGEPCMENCIAPVTVTKRAALLAVTPTDPDGRPAGTVPEFVQASAVTAVDPAPAASSAAVAAAAPAGDEALLAEGAAAFRKCAACHKVGEGARNGTGPHLNGVVGRVAGGVEGFAYSAPLKDAGAGGLVWDVAALDAFLADPKGYMPRNKMAFAGLKRDSERAAVIAFLAAQVE